MTIITVSEPAKFKMAQEDSFDEICKMAMGTQDERAPEPMDTISGAAASLSRDAATPSTVADVTSGGPATTPETAEARRPPSPITWCNRVEDGKKEEEHQARAADKKKKAYRKAREASKKREEEEKAKVAARPKEKTKKEKGKKKEESESEEEKEKKPRSWKTSTPASSRPAFFKRKPQKSAEEKRRDDEQWKEEVRTGNYKQSAASKDYRANVPRIIFRDEDGETTPVRPEVTPTLDPSNPPTPLLIEQPLHAPQETPENMDTTSQPPQAPAKYKVKPIVWDLDAITMPPPSTPASVPAPPTPTPRLTWEEKDLQKEIRKEEERNKLQTPFRRDPQPWNPDEHDGQPYRMVAERNLQTEMTAAGSSRRTEIRTNSHRSGTQTNIGDDWERDPTTNNPGAAARMSVRIVDESKLTADQRHEANRLANERHVRSRSSRKRGKRITGNARKLRIKETRKDLEAQKNNLRRWTAPQTTEVAGNRREDVSSGYATPEEPVTPTTPRSPPQSPRTEFKITRLAKDIADAEEEEAEAY